MPKITLTIENSEKKGKEVYEIGGSKPFIEKVEKLLRKMALKLVGKNK